jgi:Tfp pilus assembly protein PilF
LGLTYLENKDFDLALEEFNSALAQQEDSATLYNNRGLVFYHKQDCEHSLKDFNKAIALDNVDSTYFYNRGNTYLLM